MDWREYHTLHHHILRLVLHQIAALPALLAGLSLRGHFVGGLYWLAASIVLP
jgi:hypothetical protein